MSPAARPGPLKQIGVTALTFFVVENAYKVGKLLATGWGGLTNEGSKEPYVIEMGLITMGIGATVSVLIALRQQNTDEVGDWAVLTGALVGVLSVLMEVLEVSTQENVWNTLSWRPLYFLAVYTAAFLVPAVLAAVKTSKPDLGWQRMNFIGWTFLIGGIAALIGENSIRAIIRFIPVFDYDGPFKGAVDDLTFRPSGLVWGASVWAVICLLPRIEGKMKGSAALWSGAYLALGALFAAGYAVFFVTDADVERIGSTFAATLGFASLVLAPLAATLLLVDPVKLNVGRGWFAAGISFLFTATAMAISLAKGFGSSVSAAVGASLVMGVAGALVPTVAIMAIQMAKRFGIQAKTHPNQ
ncbi:MAG: hypothetical protein AAF066_02405 [Pseudomonadota bacterium]